MNYSLQSALTIANRVIEILSPCCDRIHIAGSIRRKKSEVKDIEIVCQPKKIFVKDPSDLFGEGKWNISNEFIDAINRISTSIEKGKFDGRYMKVVLKGGIPMDLFMPDPDDFYRQLVIRTGSAEYVHNVIAASWRQKGWCGVNGLGLRLISQSVSKQSGDGKTVWTCTNPKATKPPVWESEEEVFKWLGLPITPPECREIKTHFNHLQ